MEEQFGIYFYSYLGGQQMQEDENYARFLEGSHANFSALLDYIEKANPEKIIVDNYRTQQGIKFTKILQEKGYDVICQPI